MLKSAILQLRGGLRYDKEYDRRTSIKTHYDVRIAFIVG